MKSSVNKLQADDGKVKEGTIKLAGLVDFGFLFGWQRKVDAQKFTRDADYNVL